jgi:Phage integrase family
LAAPRKWLDTNGKTPREQAIKVTFRQLLGARALGIERRWKDESDIVGQSMGGPLELMPAPTKGERLIERSSPCSWDPDCGAPYQKAFERLMWDLKVKMYPRLEGKIAVYESCAGVEFPVSIRGLFRPHYVTWSEQQMIEFHAPEHLRNVVRIITETGLRVYKELTPMKKDQVDLENAVVWIPDSKTPNGVAEVPLTCLSAQAFQDQLRVAGPGPYLFPSDKNPSGHQTTLKTVWHKTLRRANIPYFRIYDLRSTYATRLSAGGVADEWVTQMFRQGDAKVFKKYSQMKLQMKREALEKINRHANEAKVFDTVKVQ